MKYLVTGGAGFIGSNLAKTLEKRLKARVVALDDFSSGHFENLIDFSGGVIAGSVCDDSWQDKAGNFDAIFHQAAITDTTVLDQKKMMDVNVEGFRNVLGFALKRKIRRIIYASSAGVYGNGPCPMKEGQKPEPENVYAYSKMAMDKVAGDFAAEHPKYTLVGLRYFNVYGPGESYKGKFASMIYQLYLQMKAGKKPRIFKSGGQMRDFVHVTDIVEANIKALRAGQSCVVNAATGKPENFNRIIELLNKYMGTELKTEYFDNPYDFYQEKTEADMTLAGKLLKFEAKHSLEEGIRNYVKILEKAR